MRAARRPRSAGEAPDEAGDSAAGRLRVVYLAGAQHCGSTLLDAVLGHAPGACSLGEVGGFHRYEIGQECDCRRPAVSCTTCAAVVASLATAPGLPTYQAVSPGPLKERRIHWSVVGTRGRAAYAGVADDLFEAVSATTGATILIDSSKNIGRAAALIHDSRHDVRVVHLVRDGRGYLRSKRRRAVHPRPWHRLPIATVPWLAKNLALSGSLRRRAPDGTYLLCRYEDLMADPEAELARIGQFAGIDTSGLAERATSGGLTRGHLYEPRRRVDYRVVHLDPARLSSPPLPRFQNLLFWVGGGFLSSRWGYTRRQ